MNKLLEQIERINQIIKSNNLLKEQTLDPLPSPKELENFWFKNDDYKSLIERFKPIVADCRIEVTEDLPCVFQKINDFYESKYPKKETQEALERAKSWWRNRLEDKTFITKFKENNNLNDQQVSEILYSYKERLNSLELKFTSLFDTSPFGNLCEGFDEIFFIESAGRLKKESENLIFVNVLRLNVPYEEKEGGLAHEISHALDAIHPTTPLELVNKIDREKGSKGVTDMLKSKLSINDNQVESIYKKWGYPSENIDRNSSQGALFSGYITNPGEIKGFITGLKNLLKTENITIDLLKPYILGEKNNINTFWLLKSWAKTNYMDLDEFISYINSIVKNEFSDPSSPKTIST